MAQTRLTQTALAARLSEAAAQVAVGGMYRHYKNKLYQVVGVALLEATNEPCVIYQAQYGVHATFIRPLSNWLEIVEVDGQPTPRFELV